MNKLMLTVIVVSSVCLSTLSTGENLAPEKNSGKTVWVSMGSDAVELIQQKFSSEINLVVDSQFSVHAEKSSSKANENGVAVVRIKESDINDISRLMHRDFNRCAGFIVHSSLDKAKAYAKASLQTKNTQQIAYSIDNTVAVEALISQVTTANLNLTVNHLASYHNRYYRAQSGVDSANWIKDEWTTIAANRADIRVDFFQHNSWQQPSVIATITGSTNPEQIVIIGGHLDSINGGNPSSGLAPGADDNASGIAIITETLTAIVASDYRPARTIKLMGYAAEEVGLRGSDAIAQDYSNKGLDVIGVAQFDMTGFHGTNHQDITFISDFTDATQNQYMTQLMDAYLPTLTYGFDRCGYACSDHASWNNRNYPASFPFESTSADLNRAIHTVNDSIFDADHAVNFAKLAVTYAAEMAKGGIGVNTTLASLQFSQTNLDVNKGEPAVITVIRNGSLDTAVSIDYATNDGTAVAGTDYTAVSGTLNWDAQDSTEKTISISTNDIAVTKSFSILLSNPQGNGEIGLNNSITVTIKAAIETPPPSSSGGGGSLGYFLLFSLLFIRIKR